MEVMRTKFEPFTDILQEQDIPLALNKDFFSAFNATDRQGINEKIHYYVIIDAAKDISFPSSIQNAGELKSLFEGILNKGLYSVAPYLLMLNRSQYDTKSLLKKLFYQHESEVLSYWKANPAIFIRSNKDFNTVYQHLQQFVVLHDYQNNKDVLFRFYEPDVLSEYLHQLAHVPSYLALLFGIQNNTSIIDAFGIRQEDVFEVFSFKSHVKDTPHINIQFGKIEQDICTNINWVSTKKKLIAQLLTFFPNTLESDASEWLNEARDRNIISSESGYWLYLSGRTIAEMGNLDYFSLLENMQKREEGNTEYLVEILLEKLMDEAK